MKFKGLNLFKLKRNADEFNKKTISNESDLKFSPLSKLFNREN